MDPHKVYMSLITSNKDFYQKYFCQISNRFRKSPFWLFWAKLANWSKMSLIFKKNLLGFLRSIIYSHIHHKFGGPGGFKFLKLPPKPPKKVRKLCCFDRLNGKSSRNLPIKSEMTLTWRKYQLWTPLLNFHYVHMKLDLMRLYTPVELKFKHKSSILEVWDAGEFGLRSSLGIYFWHQYRIYHTLIFLKI